MPERTKMDALIQHLTSAVNEIGSLTFSLASMTDKDELYMQLEDARYTELERAQQLMLLLTQMIVPADVENLDEGESAFAEGELNDVKKEEDKAEDKPTESAEE